MTTEQKTREQERAEAKARHEQTVERKTAELTALLAETSRALADLDPQPEPKGFKLPGGVRVFYDVGPTYGYSHWGTAPDRIAVCYEEPRPGHHWRGSRRKTLTYTKLDDVGFPIKFAARLRGIVATQVAAVARRKQIDAEAEAHRKAEAERTLPVRNFVLAWKADLGEAARPYCLDMAPAPAGDRYKLTLSLKDAEVELVLNALAAAKGGGK